MRQRPPPTRPIPDGRLRAPRPAPQRPPPRTTLKPWILATAMIVVILGLAGATAFFLTGMAREVRALSPTAGDVRLWLTGDDEPLGADSRVRRFTVSRGESASRIAERLEEEGFIRSALAFRLRARSESLD